MITSPIKTGGRLFYGWIIVAVCFLCWLMNDFFGYYTFGLFIGPINRELGWTTFMITLGLTLKSITAAFLGPVTGYLADKKYGARLVMPLGVLAAGTSLVLLSHAQYLWQFFFSLGIIGALGAIGFGGVVTHTIIAKWFIRLRGRAMGIATMGVSVSGLIFIPLNHYLISNHGWRNALLVGGIIIWGVAFVPTALFIRRRPEDIGLKPDGDNSYEADPQNGRLSGLSEPGREEYSWTLKEALRTKALWFLLAAINVTGLSLSGVMIHFYPYLEEKGISPDIAAAAMTTYALCAALVKVPWGFLAERFSVRYCNIAVYTGSAAGVAILLNSQSTESMFIYAVIYGMAMGGLMVIREILFADYYGRTFLGTIRGVVMPLNLISMAGGPVFAAWLHDASGGYRLPYVVFFCTFIIGIIFMYLAKPPIIPKKRIIKKETPF